MIDEIKESIETLSSATTVAESAEDAQKWAAALKTTMEAYKTMLEAEAVANKAKADAEASQRKLELDKGKQTFEQELETQKLEHEREKLELEKTKAEDAVELENKKLELEKTKAEDAVELENKKLELDERKWVDIPIRELAASKKEVLCEALKVVGGIAAAAVGGFIAFKSSEMRVGANLKMADALTEHQHTDILQTKPVEAVDRVNRINFD